MRKIKNNVFMILACLPLLAYILVVFRGGAAPEFLTTVTNAFGNYGMFFEEIITPLLTEFVPLADSVGVAMYTWLIGYYITLIFVYLVFSMFTFLVTMFMDKIDSIKGGIR